MILFSLIGCTVQDTPKENNTDFDLITEEQAESKVKWLIHLGIITDDNIYTEEEFSNLKLNIKSQQDSYIITLDNEIILTMDKKTGIIYCIENKGQENCDENYITYLDGGIIIDADSFSCVPGEQKASKGESGMNCQQAIIDEYYSLKKQLITPSVR